jgi:hypothetical protein
VFKPRKFQMLCLIPIPTTLRFCFTPAGILAADYVKAM